MNFSILAKSVKTEETKCSDTGCAYVKKSKEHSCDDSALLIIKDEYALIGVFDGVSGQPHASIASETALITIANYVEKNIKKKKPEELLDNTISEANYAVQAGGTTASIALILQSGEFFYANIGDSHIYKISNNKVTRLTKDDRDSSSFASYIKSRYYVGECIGSLITSIYSGKGRLEKGDAIFAMSDGIVDNLFVKVEGGIVTDTSGKEDLEKLFKGKNIKEIIESLAEEIKKRMQLKEEIIDKGILVPKEDDASIVIFQY